MDVSMLDYQVRAREALSAHHDAAIEHILSVAMDVARGLQQQQEGDPNQVDIEPAEVLENVVRISTAALGMSCDVGRFASKLTMIIHERQGVIDHDTRRQLASELGRVLWDVSEICSLLGLHLSDVAKLDLAMRQNINAIERK